MSAGITSVSIVNSFVGMSEYGKRIGVQVQEGVERALVNMLSI
jgi:hypothetical protein